MKSLSFRLHCSEITTHRMQISMIIAVVLLSIVLRTQLLLQILVITAIFLTPLLVDLSIFHRRSAYFHQEIVSFLDGVLLQMRLGRSFKESMQSSLLGRPVWFEKEFHLFFESLNLRQKFLGVIGSPQIFAELEQVARTSVKQMERLKSLRRKLKIEDDFRRKSSKSLAQVRAQSILLCLMYLPLLGFQIFRGLLHQAPALLFGSMTLFVFGTLWIAAAGRRYKWKT